MSHSFLGRAVGDVEVEDAVGALDEREERLVDTGALQLEELGSRDVSVGVARAEVLRIDDAPRPSEKAREARLGWRRRSPPRGTRWARRFPSRDASLESLETSPELFVLGLKLATAGATPAGALRGCWGGLWGLAATTANLARFALGIRRDRILDRVEEVGGDIEEPVIPSQSGSVVSVGSRLG